MQVTSVLDRTFNIEAGERRLVGLLFLQYFCTGIASVFTQTSSFALFLSIFDAESLPYTYLIMAVALSGLTLLNLKIGRRLGFGGQLRFNLTTQILVTLAFAAGLSLGAADWVVFLLPVLFQLAVTYGNMTFWSLAGRLLDVRQGKRLFGLVGAGEWTAIVIMGFLMPVIVPQVGLQNLLWLAVLGAAAAFLLLNITLRNYADRLQDAPQNTADSTMVARPSPSSLIRNPYVVTLIALTLVWWVGFFFFDNIFYEQSARQYPDSTELASFLGLYLGVLGILTLLTSSLLTGRVISTLGLRSSLLILPVGLLVGAAIMAGNIILSGPFMVLFIAAVASRVWGIWIGFSIDQAARSILYQPLPPQVRTSVQMAADGVAQPTAIGVAGVTMLALGALFPGESTPLVFGAVALSAVLVGIVLLASRGYVRTLIDALATRRLRPTGTVIDRTSLTILERALDNPSPGAALYAMRMLRQVSPATLEAELGRLLKHPSAHVRQHALERIAAEGLEGRTEQVREMLTTEPLPLLRGEALATLGTLGHRSDLHSSLAADELSVRAGAITGLLMAGAGRHSSEAATALARLAASPDATERREAARIVAKVGVGQPASRELLVGLISDPDLAVRRQAIRAAGQTADPGLLFMLVALLNDRKVRSAARSALIAAKDAALGPVAAALNDDSHDSVALLSILGAIGTPAARKVLVPYVESPSIARRDAAVRALSASGYQLEPGDRELGLNWLMGEAEYGRWLCQSIAGIGDQPRSALVIDALGDQLRACRERLFMLLGVIGSRDVVRRAWENLDGGADRQVAYAHEVIDLHVPHALKPVVLPLMASAQPGEIVAKLGAAARPGAEREILEDMAADLNGRVGRWARACARFALGPETGQPGTAAQREDQKRDMEIIEKVLMLRTVGIFDATKDEVLAEVAAIAENVEAPAGTRIVEQGSRGDSMYVLVSGRVRVHHDEVTLNELGPGEVFGEMALLDPEPRSASVTVIEDAQFLRLDQSTLFELIEEHPEVARGMLQVLTRRLRQLINREPQAA